jgi:cytochrome c553
MRFLSLSLLFSTILWAQSGKEIFDSKCKSCHGINGQINVFGKTRAIAGMPENELGSKLKAYKEGSINQYGFGDMMKKNLALISSSQLSQLAEHIASLEKKK